MTKSNELINQAVEVLIANGMEKTGVRSAFTGYQDLRIDEVEMMEFLFQFDDSMDKFNELALENKGEPANTPIWKLMYHLNQTYNFGFLNRNKVEVLDTISDISQIQIKPRHLVFLDMLKSIKPNIETLFVGAYNQTQPHFNHFRVEQVLFYLRESLEYEGIDTKYSDFRLAVPHTFTGDWLPYFCKSNYGYYIVDNLFGGYAGSLYITAVDKGEKPQWYYGSSNGADRWHGHESTAIAEIEKLRALNSLAGFEDLDWKIVFANRHDVPFRIGYHSL
ncbi:MAG: hypothetical protein US15_C0036G0001, partial [Candidatus Moranbacteria bacterium GW2011_GWF1_36_4]